MKYLFALFVFLTVELATDAQTLPVDTFFTEGATWTYGVNYERRTGSSNGGDIGAKRIQYKIEPDTFVAGVKYHPVSLWEGGCYGYSWANWQPPEDYIHTATYNEGRLGRIRVEGEKVYFTKDITGLDYQYNGYDVGTECLIYDFSLAVGDTFNSINQNFYLYTVDIVDTASLTLSNGHPLRKYDLSAFSSGVFWLRGIGSSDGLINYCKFTNGPVSSARSTYFLCYDHPSFYYHHLDWGPLFRGDLQNNCFDVTTLDVSQPLVKNSTYILFPNPVSGNELTLRHPTPRKIATIEVYNTFGSLLSSVYSNCSNTEINFSVPGEPGIYLLKVYLNDGSFETKTFTKM